MWDKFLLLLKVFGHNKTNPSSSIFYFFTVHVLMPNALYNGQKLIKLVVKSTAPSSNNTVPNAPPTVCVTYNAVNNMARTILIILSVNPIFFVMLSG